MKEQNPTNRRVGAIATVVIVTIVLATCVTFTLLAPKFGECHFGIECGDFKTHIDLSK